MLNDKVIVFGVTGGIAAYKAADIVSRLKKNGADIHVIMTRGATKFVGPITFRELTQNPVITSMWEEPKRMNMQHISLAQRADLLVIAPATANIIGKIANGIADDMLTTTVMATTAPVLLAPAMNTRMYQNPIVQDNIAKLRRLNYRFVGPEAGYLACGEQGPGRLADPDVIVTRIREILLRQQDFAGITVLVTAGGTQEPIDPVRFIGNRSSGKMGYAIAAAACARGARVILISGPTHLLPPAGVEVIPVNTAREMRDAVLRHFAAADVVVKAAAVADYRPKAAAAQKIKKTEGELVLTLERNPDILQELGEKKTKQILVGFAAETEDVLRNAAGKMAKKRLDFIVANDITQPGAGFNADTNIVKLLCADGSVEEWPQMAKREVADRLLDKIRCTLTSG